MVFGLGEGIKQSSFGCIRRSRGNGLQLPTPQTAEIRNLPKSRSELRLLTITQLWTSALCIVRLFDDDNVVSSISSSFLLSWILA